MKGLFFYKAREISRCKQSNGVAAAAPENEQVDQQGSGKSRPSTDMSDDQGDNSLRKSTIVQ